MDVKLLYVNKGSAYVKNEDTGEFISEVASTICKAGDSVSIEGIAVSTKGTGSDTIEVPVSTKDYRYKTNELKVEFMTYLHDNFQYAVRLPVSGQNVFKATPTQLHYGDVLPDQFRVSNNQDYIPKNPYWAEIYGGYRYYIGSWGNAGDDPTKPTASTQNNQNVSTGKLVFNFLTTEVPLKVDYGYNTPENITSKITSDLHSSMFIPQRLNEEIEPLNYYTPNVSNVTNQNIHPTIQATCVSEDSSVITIYGIPQSYKNASAVWYSTYQNLIAVQQPFYWYWGTRLQAELPNGCQKQLGYMNATYPGNNLSQADIVTINQLRQTTTSPTTYVNTSDVIATNLQFDERTISRVQNYIHSMKAYNSSIKVTREQMKQNKDKFVTRFLFGKFFDEDASPYANLTPLPDKMGTGATNSIVNNWCFVKSFFNEPIFNDAVLPIPQAGMEILNESLTLANGIVLATNREVCEYYDINIVRVRSTGNTIDTIGFIVQGRSIQRLHGNPANRIVVPGSFCLFDSTFSGEQSQALIIATTDLKVGGNKHTLADIVPGFNIGAPNINLTFNGDRSRFAWSDMYWANYIGNPQGGDESNPDADTQAISCNRITSSSFYRPLAPAEVIFTQYAQSGLAFWNFYVRNTANEWVKISKTDQDDIKEKYNNGNFMYRLGFEFNDIFDSFGLPIAFYQDRATFNNTEILYPQFFPFPLTNNPEVDTAFNISINATDTQLPTFNLSLERNVTGINVASQSSEILARNKPDKLATPFWLIESDILPGVKYSVEGNTRNILGVVNRAYGNGDFVFGFASDYKFIVTKGFVISHIKTNILTADLLPALVDDNTTVIYKIESPILPNFVSEEEARELAIEMAQKQKK